MLSQQQIWSLGQIHNEAIDRAEAKVNEQAVYAGSVEYGIPNPQGSPKPFLLGAVFKPSEKMDAILSRTSIASQPIHR